MNRYKSLLQQIFPLVLMALTSGCGWNSPSDDSAYRHVFIEEEARLTDDDGSPYCDFAVDFTYLDETDSIAEVVNRAVQAEFLGADYATLEPMAAVDSFRRAYIAEYRKETGELYRMEKDSAVTLEEIPAWFGQTYSLVTFVEEGHSGVLNASANYFVDMGGAHPNQWSRWMNLDFMTGKVLTKDDVFPAEATKAIENLLLDNLVRMQAEANPDTEVKNLEDLQQLGFLQMTNMYIPDNFLLSKRAALFLFNRYDIAPYSAGEIVIEVPYEEIGHLLKK